MFKIHIVNEVVYASAEFSTEEEAREIAAKFPKFCKVGVVRVYSYVGSKNFPDQGDYWGLNFRQDMRPTKTTGRINETGIKRTAKFFSIAEDLGYEIVMPYINSASELTVERTLRGYLEAA